MADNSTTTDDGDFICEGCGAVMIGDPHYLPREQIAYCADCFIKEGGSDECKSAGQ